VPHSLWLSEKAGARSEILGRRGRLVKRNVNTLVSIEFFRQQAKL